MHLDTDAQKAQEREEVAFSIQDLGAEGLGMESITTAFMIPMAYGRRGAGSSKVNSR
jgi:hypothetical protein